MCNAACRPTAVKCLHFCRPVAGFYVSENTAGQDRRARLPGKTAGQDCRARLPGKTAGQDCRTRLPGKSAGQGCRASLVGKTAGQDCRARLWGKAVNILSNVCITLWRVSLGSSKSQRGPVNSSLLAALTWHGSPVTQQQ
jgi:hypothetical protein